jgi:hypothetical protein
MADEEMLRGRVKRLRCRKEHRCSCGARCATGDQTVSNSIASNDIVAAAEGPSSAPPGHLLPASKRGEGSKRGAFACHLESEPYSVKPALMRPWRSRSAGEASENGIQSIKVASGTPGFISRKTAISVRAPSMSDKCPMALME